MCIQQEVIKQCNCSMPYVFNFDYAPTCTRIKDFECIQTNVYTQIENIFQGCTNCPLECQTIRYIPSASSGIFPTPRYANDLINTNKTVFKSLVSFDKNMSAIRGSFISMSVYYSELKYTEIQQLEKNTLVDLICGIGGTLGLFIGASVLSLVEIIEAIFTVALVFFQSKLIKPSPQKS